MFPQVRNFWKAVSAPLMNSQLFGQYCRTDVFKTTQRPLSVLSTQVSVLSWQQNHADRATDKTSLLSSQSVTFQSVRTNVRVHYRPSAWKRYNKHNIERRLSTPNGIDMLWRRTLKGRHQLAVYERILPNTVNGKILAPHQLKFQALPFTKRQLRKPGLY